MYYPQNIYNIFTCLSDFDTYKKGLFLGNEGILDSLNEDAARGEWSPVYTTIFLARYLFEFGPGA